MRTSTFGVSVFALCALAGQASAQLSPTGPFTGPFTEQFNMNNSGFTTCITERVFNGRADLCTVNASNVPVTGCNITSGWSFNCSMSPHSPSRFFGSANGAALYTFDTPVGGFGGYMGSNGNSNIASGATVTFYDEAENVIGTEDIRFPTCGAWEWYGWTSTVLIKKVKVHGNGYSGPFVMMDDMEFMEGGGGPACYPDCDGDHNLNVNDFICFQAAFAAGTMAQADCDQSGTLNVNDFVCFQAAFAAGCSQL